MTSLAIHMNISAPIAAQYFVNFEHPYFLVLVLALERLTRYSCNSNMSIANFRISHSIPIVIYL